MIYNMGSGILRAVGDSKRPLYFPDRFLSGQHCARPFYLSQCSTWALPELRLRRLRPSFLRDPDTDRPAAHPGFLSPDRFQNPVSPRSFYLTSSKSVCLAGLQSAMYSISNLLIQSSINSFGTDTIAAWTAYGKVGQYFLMIMGATAFPSRPSPGKNFGAGKYDRIKKVSRICLGLARDQPFPALSFLNFGGTILLLFTRDTNVINICIGMMRVVSPAYVHICIEIAFRYLPRLRGFLSRCC